MTCRPASTDELPAVAAFVRAVYDARVAPDESAEGRATFAAYVAPEAMAARLDAHAIWVAERAGRMVGALEMREGTHVALLFVALDAQRQGIARRLLEAALGPAARWPALTVNSTPGAVAAYGRLGFVAVAPPTTRNGLRFQAMERPAAP